MITGSTIIYSLYGSPVAHSLSPVIFNTTFEKLSLSRMYIPFEVGRDKLEPAVEAARTLKFNGFNVTMPLKTTIIEFLDQLDSTAKEIGAVNTVSRTNTGLVGHNTDGDGALRAIRSYGLEPKRKRVVVLGAGGAAKALVHALSREKNEIMILNRDLERARKLAEPLSGPTKISYGHLDKESVSKHLDGADLLVNATPSHTATILSQLDIPLGKARGTDWVFDLAYDKTSEKVPAAKGTISPFEMLVQQAALSYEIWLNEKAPLDLMRSSLVDYLGKDWK